MKLFWRKTAKKMLIIPMIVSMVFTCMPQMAFEVSAVEPIAKIGNEPYYNFGSLADDIDDLGGKTATVEMLKDWDYASDGKVKERIIVPRNCNLTLNMNGHMFNRRLTQDDDYETNGELFALRYGARMTVNGGTQETSHTVYVHNSTSRDKYATKTIETKGGTLSGGSSTNGAGCFHMCSHCTLTLNDVTIAGCRAEQRAGTDGYGGAIYFEADAGGEGSCTVSLNNSIITGCYAYNDGGAIYSDGPRNIIYLKNSKITNNFCGDDGGAFAYNYANGSLSGDKDSAITGNQAANRGGAIWIDDSGMNISGLKMDQNHANKGGAIYINGEEAAIASCEITGNGASFSGGGVYVAENIDKLTVSGTTIIRDNGHDLYLSDDDPEDNRVKFNLVKGADVRVTYYNTKGKSSIMVTPGSLNDTTKAKNCIKYLTAGNSGYYFDFDPAINVRKIYYKKGTAPVPPKIQGVGARNANNASGKKAESSVIAGKIGTVGPGGSDGTDYDLIRGFYLHEKTDSGTEDKTGIFYYTDAFFDETVDPAAYNYHLATASWVLAFSGTYLRKFEDPDSKGNTYYNKHAGARQFLADIGCPDQNIYVNDSMVSKPGTDTVGCTIGSKYLAKADGTKTGRILIPVTVRGGGYESEWASNCTLGAGTDSEGRDGEAAGFSSAADQVVKEIDKYIKKYGLEDEIKEGNVTFWVAGFSRAGATANITSKRLVEKYADGSGAEGKTNTVFGYTCEAAKGGTDKAEKLDDKTRYYCIHNMVNTADVVPLVAPWQMGFKRYGVDHYIPGTTAGNVMSEPKQVKHAGSSGITQVTTYRDNEVVKTKTTDYDNLRDGRTSAYNIKMQQHLSSIDSDLYFDDYFHPMAMKFIPPKMYENGVYDGNRVEDFLEDFFRGAQEGLPEDDKEWSIAMGSRKVWAEDKTKINDVTYSTVQDAMRDTMSMVFTMSDEQSDSFMERASAIASRIDLISFDTCMLDVYLYVIGDWHNLGDTGKEDYTKFFWNKLKEVGALDELDPDAVTKLENNWPTLANFIFRLIDNDYNYKPGKHTDISKWAKGMTDSMTYIPTFATFSSYILANHYPETNIAWVRLDDDWYIDGKGDNYRKDLTEYEIIPFPTVNVPGAYVIEESEQDNGSGGTEPATTEKELVPDDKTANRLTGDRRIILENKHIVGEAVYYDLEDITDGESSKMLEQDQIYRGGVDLTLGAAGEKAYKITTYDMSYGVKSDEEIYYINLTDGKHDVIINDEIDGETEGQTEERTRTYKYEEGDEVRISAGAPSGKVFTSWTVLDNKDKDVTNTIFAGDYAQYKTKANAAFIMPTPDEAGGFSEDYTLTFTANYDNKISHITPAITAPEVGVNLASDAKIVYNTIEGKEFVYPITWTYTINGKDIVTSGPARADTTYTAWITMPQEKRCPVGSSEPVPIAFANKVTYTPPEDASGGDLKRNPSDGSILLRIIYKTGEGPTPPAPSMVKLTIKAYDQNIENYLSDVTTYFVEPGTKVTVSPMVVADEMFYQWNMFYKKDETEIDSGVRIDPDKTTSKDRTVELIIPQDPSGDEMIIQAEYRPLVCSIAVEVPAPVAGQEMATGIDSMIVTISNEYIVEQECTAVTWSPAPKNGKADYEVPYTAMVTLKPYSDGDHEGTIKVTDKNDPSKVYYIPTDLFLYAENATATMNGEEAFLDTEANAVSYTFPGTKYHLAANAKSPDDVSGIPRGTDIGRYIPDTVKILRSDGMEVDAQVDWNEPTSERPEGDLGEIIWTVTGTVILPDNMDNPYEYSLDVSMKLTVDPAPYAASPDASLPSGTYLTDQETTLTTDTEGGEIWYTLDGSDPKTSDTRTKYEGAPVSIDFDPDAEKTSITLRAYTAKDGYQDSIISTYIYEWTDEVPVPAGSTATYSGESQIGVEGSPFYTLVAEEGSGVTIDEEGNAIATNAGTYTVTAKIKDGYEWKIGNDEDGSTTTDDQTITFTIDPAQISDVADVTAEGKFKTIEDLKKALKVVPKEGVKLTEGVDYEIVYGEVINGKVTVTVKGKGNYTGTIISTFIIDPDKKTYWITLDLNGGELDGNTGVVKEQYVEKTVLTLPKPTREGYEFLYWKGSKYKAGDKYKVTEDHTFVAQWKQENSDDPSKDGNGSGNGDSSKSGNGTNTGDSANILLWLTLLTASLLGAIAVVLFRRKRLM